MCNVKANGSRKKSGIAWGLRGSPHHATVRLCSSASERLSLATPLTYPVMQEQIGAKKLARPDPTRRIAVCLSGKMKCRYLGISYFIYEQFKSRRLTHNLLSSNCAVARFQRCCKSSRLRLNLPQEGRWTSTCGLHPVVFLASSKSPPSRFILRLGGGGG